MSDETKLRCADDLLEMWAKSGDSPALRLAARELLDRRAHDRMDSHQARQLRKLRWSVEHVLTKLDQLAARNGADTTKADGENLAGTHGPATHGVRCSSCDATHKRSA